MPTYVIPQRDMEFVLYELLNIKQTLAQLPAFTDVDVETINQTIDAAGRFAKEVLAPLNGIGDAQGCSIIDGKVKTPDGFPAAYQRFVEAGWPTLSASEQYGGQHFPSVVTNALFELFQAANLSWCMFVGIAHGAYKCIHRYGSSELKAIYLPYLVNGQWTATMCLTESHCGSDLGLIRSQAVPQNDGSFRITGSKIFISGGDHDLAQNIVHLVLARLPGAPVGSKGISLFLVPKFVPNADGSLKPLNNVTATSLEHKTGLRGSATCAMNFDGASGWLVGEEGRGVMNLFLMMNEARLGVGIQAVGVSQQAHQNAVDYARERLQMRSVRGAKFPDQAADPIMVHADVRRMLLTQKAWTEGARMLVYWLSLQLDIEAAHPDPIARRQAADLVTLLTPVAKAFSSENASSVADLTVQVYGGHGYMVDCGVEQFVRDARVQQIYEGTNGIQAQDLLGRKVLADGGEKLGALLQLISDFVADHWTNLAMREFLSPLINLPQQLLQLTEQLTQAADNNPDEIGAAANDYLRILGHVVFAYLFARAAAVAGAKIAFHDPFYGAKLATTRFYFAKLLPEVAYRFQSVQAGTAVLDQLEETSWFL
ncbi:acyl-CoA dehydrogenase C-terminal domain-containing protein [Sapientia aquatica]|uniref:3-methylmercaptopropionyl-CoA dehydrogenase n=1 Tax=Sapientia aquatica TaxID=1549640 RepID=A0A4V3AUP1_9BURK|nr:acyl-CoA dehydrogenase C-terminal domain-containing protein [Sapientia aquatica]TDK65640.1 acyl-CoA dehydrogenase [Sapientia aquatica]